MNNHLNLFFSHLLPITEKVTSDDFMFSDESSEDLTHSDTTKSKTTTTTTTIKNKKTYYSFFLIDYGREDMVITINNSRRDIFILPINEKLMIVGNFALKCSLNESSVRMRKMYSSTNQMKEAHFKHLFEDKFKKMMENRQCRAHLCQITTVQKESEALVTLYLLPDDAHDLALQEHVDVAHMESLRRIPFLMPRVAADRDVVVSVKLNAIYFIMRSINVESLDQADGEEAKEGVDSDEMMVV